LVDWRDSDTDQARSRLLERIESNRRNGFDLASAPLLKFTLIQLSDQKWTLLLTFHHLVVDGWATHVLLKEITNVYRGKLKSLSAPFEFKRYIGHLQNFDSESAKEFWRQELSGFENANSIGRPFEKNAESDNSNYLQTSFEHGCAGCICVDDQSLRRRNRRHRLWNNGRRATSRDRWN